MLCEPSPHHRVCDRCRTCPRVPLCSQSLFCTHRTILSMVSWDSYCVGSCIVLWCTGPLSCTTSCDQPNEVGSDDPTHDPKHEIIPTPVSLGPKVQQFFHYRRYQSQVDERLPKHRELRQQHGPEEMQLQIRPQM